LGEAINIGVLFYFPDTHHLEFSYGNNTRVKSIYNDFDATLFNSLINTIKAKLKSQNDLFRSNDLDADLKEYINNYVLAETESSLQFSDPIITKNTFSNFNDAIKFYSSKLLPGIITGNPSIIRYNDSFIIKTFAGYLFKKNKEEIERKLKKNFEIKDKGFNWKFNFAWQFESLNLVKPVAFDLNDELDIQSKSAQLLGYLSIFKNYAQRNDCRFDLLVSEPRERSLYDAYDNVLNLLYKFEVPKRIIKQDSWENYSKETIAALLS
jgi:hypothetical protein